MDADQTWRWLSWRMQAHLEAFCGGAWGIACLPSSAAGFFLQHGLAERTEENSRGLRPTQWARDVVHAGRRDK